MKTLRYNGCLFLLLFFGVSLHAQNVPPALAAILDHTLDSMRTVTGAKSLSAAIQFSDEAVWAHAKGISSAIPNVNVTPQDAYLIGSVTKTLTSACVLQLADEGLLNLDDSIHEWLDPMPYINPDITIRQLLQHTSGLFDLLNHPHQQDSLMADMSRIWTAEELIERFMAPPPAQPGAGWAYCNTNYFLLSIIIKHATGNPFYTEIRNRFFTPQGLNTFAIPAFETLNAPVAHLWLDITGDNILDDAHDFYMNYMALNSTVGAAGGYFSTPSDCTKWMRSYMRGDVLSAAMMAEAKTTVNAPGSQGNLYGLGLMKNNFLGFEAYGHGGDLAYHASSWYFPEPDASITVFTNDNNCTSWALLPVVQELLRSYNNYLLTSIFSAVPEQQRTDMDVYPNPFGDKFTIRFTLDDPDEKVDFVLLDALGRPLVRQDKKETSGGNYYTHFNMLNDLASGTYFVQMNLDGKSAKTVKLVK